jgi:hypothetical protein
MANTLINSLPDYIENKKDELFVKAVASTKTLDYVEIMPNVKYKENLNYLDSTVVLSDGSECGWNPQGSDTFGGRTIEVHPVTVQKEFCWKELRKTFANYQLSFEAGRETLPFEEKIAQSQIAAIKKEVEKGVWQGVAAANVDGFLAQMAADNAVIDVTFGEGADIVAKLDAVIAAIPAGALEKGTNVFLSWTDFRAYVKAINAECCGNRGIVDANVVALPYDGDTRITLVPVAGLEGTGKIVAAPFDAIVYGTDIEGSESVYRFFYDAKDSKFLFEVLFNMGTALKYPDEIVLGA